MDGITLLEPDSLKLKSYYCSHIFKSAQNLRNEIHPLPPNKRTLDSLKTCFTLCYAKENFSPWNLGGYYCWIKVELCFGEQILVPWLYLHDPVTSRTVGEAQGPVVLHKNRNITVSVPEIKRTAFCAIKYGEL